MNRFGYRVRAIFAVVALAAGAAAVGHGREAAADDSIPVLVMAEPGYLDTVRAQAEAGGVHTTELAIIDGFAASMTNAQQQRLRASGHVRAITVDREVSVQSVLPGTTYDAVNEPGSMYQVRQLIGSSTFWNAGYYGQGVDVAVVDTGVAPTALLGNRLVAGADTSGQGNPLSDGHGHGTHIATIIAGSETATDYTNPNLFVGIAPRARIVSIKVGDATGSTSTAKVIQGLDWVYRPHYGVNIKVVNLSFGAPPLADYRTDPLSVAVERLCSSGITVVASVGNAGTASGIAAPAYDPCTIAVGALDTMGTVSPDDDAVAKYSSSSADWSARGVDLVAPGQSVQGGVASGSMAANQPNGRIGTKFVRGSGTSQAAAVVSGAAALVAQQRSNLGLFLPESIKYAMRVNSRFMSGADARRQGSGVLYLPGAYNTANIVMPLIFEAYGGGAETAGTWDGSRWAGSRWAGSRWAGQAWMTNWG